MLLDSYVDKQLGIIHLLFHARILPLLLLIFKKVDKWTQITLDAIWKEQVQECIANDIKTGITEDGDLTEHTSS